MGSRAALVLVAAVFAAFAGCGATQGGDPQGSAAKGKKLRLARVGNFNQPVYVATPSGDKRRLFVVERDGKIVILKGGRKTTFLDIDSRVGSDGGEQGLLSVAFAPDYSTSGKFYVNYTDNSGDTRIVEFMRQSEDRADSGSDRQLLKINQPFENHNGGQLQFGPDGLLYIGMGDGGSGGDPENNAQDFGSLLGKMLRVDPNPSAGRDYSVPTDNPFTDKSGARDEVYSLGLRNPWRFSFDRKTGDIYIADVGQDQYEEVDFGRRGKARGVNYGWSAFEGFARYDSSRSAAGAKRPIAVTSHAAGNCSITAGYVVRTSTLSSLKGRYLYTDFCNGVLKSLKVRKGRARSKRTHNSIKVSSPSSFGEDSRGRIYITSLEGPVYRLAQH